MDGDFLISLFCVSIRIDWFGVGVCRVSHDAHCWIPVRCVGYLPTRRPGHGATRRDDPPRLRLPYWRKLCGGGRPGASPGREPWRASRQCAPWMARILMRGGGRDAAWVGGLKRHGWREPGRRVGPPLPEPRRSESPTGNDPERSEGAARDGRGPCRRDAAAYGLEAGTPSPCPAHGCAAAMDGRVPERATDGPRLERASRRHRSKMRQTLLRNLTRI